MRGVDHQQSGMFSYISAERRVPKDHPLRAIRVMVDAALKESSWRFDAVYASSGRPSIAPEKLLRALLLQVLYTVRSERLLMEQLDYNFLFRWFVGLNIDDPVWDVTVFTKNRERLLVGEVAECERRRENPSLKRPDRPAAPEQKSGSRKPSAKMGRGRRDERRGTVWAGAASSVCGGAEPEGGGAAIWDRPANGGEDAGVLGTAGIPAESAACAAEA